MDHDRGKRGGRVKALDALKRCKYVALTAALGIVLLLLPGGNEKKQEGGAPDAAEDFDRAALQEEMEEILSSLDGVGHLKLMLTVDGGSAYELARDEAQTQKRGGENTGERTQKSETVVLGSGVSAGVVVTRSRFPAFIGALVVCEGGDRAEVRLRVTQAVAALTGLSSERITVVKGTP